jgi:hypothetical protein
MAIAISAPYPNFFTPDGAPLEGGYVYIGVEGLNPIANPQPAYWDESLTIPAPAEVRVTGGYIVYNGAPARLYVAGNYSILVADKNGRIIFSRLYNTVYDADLFLTEPRGTLSRSMRTPGSFNINLILDGGYYSWTNAGTSNYPTGCGAADLFALEVLASPDGAGIIYQRVVDISLAYATERYSWERKSIDAGATWSDWVLPSDFSLVSGPATPYAVIADHPQTTILVTTGAGAFVCNLPVAANVIGNRVTIIKIDSGVGVIQIAPNGADVIANAGNVSVYIGTQFRHITLQAQAAGQWNVVGGEWQPNQAVDTNGTHLSLGRFHHFPLGNVIDRRAYSGAFPAVGAWTAAINIAGLYGVPVGAKCVRCKVTLSGTMTATGLGTESLGFSDNNVNTPSAYTSHPFILLSANQTNGATLAITEEIDIPINDMGQIYAYTITAANINVATSALIIVPIGYYMGD